MEAIVAYHKEVSSEGKKSNEEGGQRWVSMAKL
jgi:hypothetical protein